MKTTTIILCFILTVVSFSKHVADTENATISAFRFQPLIQQIDELIENDLTKHQLKTLPPINDEVFVRRIYLDVIGRIPTYDEARFFLNSTNKNKREKLIDQLLDSEGYVSHHFNYWADILRIKSRVSGNISGMPYIVWVKDSLRKNKPYDDFVKEMITSTGSPWEKGNGATGYYMRDPGMKEDNMANTIQIFLGTQLACAQCHDHPFDIWTRKDFYSMLAFTGTVSTREKLGMQRINREVVQKYRSTSAEAKQTLRRIRQVLGQSVSSTERTTIRLPKDYQYEDAKPNQHISAKTVFGEELVVSSGQDPRVEYAKWMTSPDNPRFTLVIANRLWKKVMGRGLIEPVDNLKENSKASNPALMELLTKEMRDQKYDLKNFLRILYNTKTYQRKAYTKDVNENENYRFPGPLRHRMSAEQVWDSILSIAIEELDSKKGMNYEDSIQYKMYENLKGMPSAELLEYAIKQTKVRERIKPVQEKVRALAAQIKKAKQQGDFKKVRYLASEIREKRNFIEQQMNDQMMDMKKGGKRQGDKNNIAFVRASELSSPSNAGHFLRQLGQSDREQVQAGNLFPSVPQVLSFYNGFVDKTLVGPQSQLAKNMKKVTTVEERVNVVFMSILSRLPTDEEKSWVSHYMSESDTLKKKGDSYVDLVWVLLNTHEFMFSN